MFPGAKRRAKAVFHVLGINHTIVSSPRSGVINNLEFLVCAYINGLLISRTT
jgi:hypothetical protein